MRYVHSSSISTDPLNNAVRNTLLFRCSVKPYHTEMLCPVFFKSNASALWNAVKFTFNLSEHVLHNDYSKKNLYYFNFMFYLWHGLLGINRLHFSFICLSKKKITITSCLAVFYLKNTSLGWPWNVLSWNSLPSIYCVYTQGLHFNKLFSFSLHWHWSKHTLRLVLRKQINLFGRSW